MSKKPYTQPQLVDRGKAADQTLETPNEKRVESDLITPTAGMGI